MVQIIAGRRTRGYTSPVRALLLLSLLFPAWSDMYRWTDKDGKVQHSSQPPSDPEARKTMRVFKTTFKPAKLQTFKSMRGPKVELLTAVWCGQCRNAKKWLDAKGVAYRELDIEKDAEGKQRYKDGGIRGVPIAYFDGTAVVGYSPQKYEEMLAR